MNEAVIEIAGIVKADDFEEAKNDPLIFFSPIKALLIILCLFIMMSPIEQLSKQYPILKMALPVFVILLVMCLSSLHSYLDITSLVIHEIAQQDKSLHLTVSQEKITIEADSQMFPTILIHGLARFYGFSSHQIPLKMVTEWKVGELNVYLFRKGKVLVWFPKRFLDENAFQSFREIIANQAIECKE